MGRGTRGISNKKSSKMNHLIEDPGEIQGFFNKKGTRKREFAFDLKFDGINNRLVLHEKYARMEVDI